MGASGYHARAAILAPPRPGETRTVYYPMGTARDFLRSRDAEAVIVGADRIAANGDTANKIGTYTVAVLANAHDVPFYVAAPVSTIDPNCPTGAEIPIEERSAEEVIDIFGSRVAPEGIHVRHPAFDVTPARLITSLVTERGICPATPAGIGHLYPEKA